MTINELIAEITSGGFTQYEESGLIDHISLRTWIKNELKRFGSNIMNLNEAILHVKDNKAKMPDNFWNLRVAVKCEPGNIVTEDPEGVLQNSFFYKERLEGEYAWNNEANDVITTPQKFVREEFYFKGAKATFNYINPTYLQLTKGFNRSICSKDCPNLSRALTASNPYSINITGDYVNTNFREGTIYMQFLGLDVDEEGKLIIPETQHSRLKEYLIYYCRMRILEDLITGDDDLSKGSLLSYYNQKATAAFSLAMTETKMEALGRNWMRVVRNKQRLQSLKYDVMLPTK